MAHVISTAARRVLRRRHSNVPLPSESRTVPCRFHHLCHAGQVASKCREARHVVIRVVVSRVYIHHVGVDRVTPALQGTPGRAAELEDVRMVELDAVFYQRVDVRRRRRRLFPLLRRARVTLSGGVVADIRPPVIICEDHQDVGLCVCGCRCATDEQQRGHHAGVPHSVLPAAGPSASGVVVVGGQLPPCSFWRRSRLYVYSSRYSRSTGTAGYSTGYRRSTSVTWRPIERGRTAAGTVDLYCFSESCTKFTYFMQCAPKSL